MRANKFILFIYNSQGLASGIDKKSGGVGDLSLSKTGAAKEYVSAITWGLSRVWTALMQDPFL